MMSMAKTKSEIQGDFMAMLKDSPLADACNGIIYRATPDTSYRPRDSRAEDIEVIITTAQVAQIQSGVATILVYVPDIDPYDNGVTVQDGRRTAQLERIAQDWIDSHPEKNSGYRLWLQDAIGTIAIPETSQHAVSIQINYQLLINP